MMMNNNMKKLKIIGVSGVARSGKDTFAAILVKKLEERGYKAKTIALANPLKKMCADFCREQLNLDVWTTEPSEKTLIRPLLVWFGDVKRKLTNGRFWIDLADKKIKEIEASGEYDYIIITDVRFQEYEKDELYWILRELNAPLVHITQMFDTPRGKAKLLPPNEHEARNDPYLNQMANYRIVWDRIISNDLLNEPTLNKHVDDFLNWLEINPQIQNL